MSVYRTEILIPVDRYLCLQLPDSLPPGRATVTVRFLDPAEASRAGVEADDPDHEDIEWWEEFDRGGGGDAPPGG